jgi:Zn-dependent metalloprotease
MHRHSSPFCCFLPPHVVDRLAESNDPTLRRVALHTAEAAAAARDRRMMFANMPGMAAIPSATGGRDRMVYTMNGGEQPLPGTLARSEAQPASGDAAVDEAFDYAGTTYDYWKAEHGRNSLNGQGMTLISSAHYGDQVANAFWNGEQMLYGDGDGTLFGRFTKSVDVVGHELTHGVVQFTANLEYYGEPGALNEHFADVFGILVRFTKTGGDPADPNNWFIGGEILLPAVGAKGIRTFTADKAYANNPHLGDDPQPKHYSSKYTGPRDFGGVHINSGIPNHAFYRVVQALGPAGLQKAGTIWYETLKSLTQYSEFQEAAEKSLQAAGAKFGANGVEAKAVADAWAAVGLNVRSGVVAA